MTVCLAVDSPKFDDVDGDWGEGISNSVIMRREHPRIDGVSTPPANESRALVLKRAGLRSVGTWGVFLVHREAIYYATTEKALRIPEMLCKGY